MLLPLTCRYHHYRGLRKGRKLGCFYISQDLRKTRIHFNSTIILEVMPSVKRKNVFLAGLRVFLFFLFLPIAWSRDQGRTPASSFTADTRLLRSHHMEPVQRLLNFILRTCFEVLE